MKAFTYIEQGKFAMRDKPVPVLQDPGDAIVRVTLAAICASDIHIRRGAVPRAVPGVTLGHELVGQAPRPAARPVGGGPAQPVFN